MLAVASRMSFNMLLCYQDFGFPAHRTKGCRPRRVPRQWPPVSATADSLPLKVR